MRLGITHGIQEVSFETSFFSVLEKPLIVQALSAYRMQFEF